MTNVITVVFFLFKQKTAYEMRISDWSSDVCSSDLLAKGQPAAMCSTGEQKALLLGLVLAHAALVAARTQHAPILLLDEVAAHLDPVRRAALFDRLAGMAGQVWLTGPEPAPVGAIARGPTRYPLTHGRTVGAWGTLAAAGGGG